jgi:hypothetical protein
MLNGLGVKEILDYRKFWIFMMNGEIDSDTLKWVRTCPIYRDPFESNYQFRFFELKMTRGYSS